MKRKLLLLSFALLSVALYAQRATVRLDASTKYQHITGFGGFVCSPQFQYGHMSTSDIKKVWGESSTVGCNIMRLYIPIGKNSWNQSLATAKQAKQMGLIVFASPWGQPAEWKTNGTSNAKNSDGTLGYLKKENWADYAQYLEEYVQYLRKNGVELDAISIQNEPDWQATYAGCMWSATDIANFVKTYGKSISCKVMAPETLAVSDSYANALNKTDILDCFDIYGGHQYGGIQSAYKNLAKKGKEIWMTEYLINWNENIKETDPNYRKWDFSKDFFNFFRAINTCMLGDFNAWIHYAAKRFYGMLGDGQCGTSSGVVTKRGYIMAHFAKFVTGMDRIGATFSGGLEGSAYQSQSGDTVVAVMANATDNELTTTLDLPFYTDQAAVVTTTKAKNYTKTSSSYEEETCRPVVKVAAQSVCTVLCIRKHDRQPSNMKGTATRFDRIDDMATTKTNFGTSYKLSGKTKTFDSSNSLISSRKNTTYGYVALNNRYSQLVMHVNKVTSTNSLTAGKPTLYYVNAKGEAVNHEYERLDLSKGQDFDLVFDLSPATLQDGCIGLLSLTCDNSQSHLSITFGDVYFGQDYAGKLSGAFVADDSNVLDFSDDAACTSIDMSNVSDLPAELSWLTGSNRVAYVAEGTPLTGTNIVAGTVCRSLVLRVDGGDFRPATAFTADAATFTCTVDGLRLLMLPFSANAPEGVKVYSIADDLSLVEMRSVPAHQPVLIEAKGEITFTGEGEVSYAASPLDAVLRGTYAAASLFAGDYVLGQQDGQWGFVRLTSASTLSPFGVYVSMAVTDAFLPFFGDGFTGINTISLNDKNSGVIYNLKGQRVSSPKHGLYIIDGKKRYIK